MTTELAELLAEHPLPRQEGGKESKGDLVIVGGAESCPGAPLLGGRAALRAGAGRVQLVVHPTVATAVGVAFPEALVLGWDHASEQLPERVATHLARAGAVVVGPGLGPEGVDVAVAVSRCLEEGVLVVDARSIPAITDPRLDRPGRCVAAPNPTEAGHLLGAPVDDRDPDVAALAKAVAGLLGGPAAVRGATTVIDDGTGAQWVERAAVPGLGTPGSGDVLVGAFGAFLVRGATPLAALGWAVATHARAGQLLASQQPIGFLSREIADAIPAALSSLAPA